MDWTNEWSMSAAAKPLGKQNRKEFSLLNLGKAIYYLFTERDSTIVQETTGTRAKQWKGKQCQSILVSFSQWCIIIFVHTSRCSRIYGGLVIPSLSMAPSGISSTNLHSKVGRSVPMSLPYAPVSSLVNQISHTPSANRQRTQIQI